MRALAVIRFMATSPFSEVSCFDRLHSVKRNQSAKGAKSFFNSHLRLNKTGPVPQLAQVLRAAAGPDDPLRCEPTWRRKRWYRIMDLFQSWGQGVAAPIFGERLT